ncbi:MAG: ornithine cyclodeaminase [Phycisphaerae bacterium]|nr:ornithine cyclodeaminase [Phycisphaerae bacterium]
MRILSEKDIREALPMREAVAAMKEAFAELSAGRVTMPVRTHIDIPEHAGTALFMPCFAERFGRIGLKIVNLFDNNAVKGVPRIQGLVCLFDGQTGSPIALLNGTYLTALRTGAASGAATDLLARTDAATVAIFGAGVQGRTQLEGVCAVRPVQKALVFDPVANAAAAFAAEMSRALCIEVAAVTSPREAVFKADVVCTATVSTTPVFDDAHLRAGTHINAVGSYKPDVQEIPTETVRRAHLIVDHRTSALGETGDLIIPLRQGLIKESDIYAELGQIAAGKSPGRASENGITLFKSVGLAIQDLAAAARAFENAVEKRLGQLVDL